MADPSRPDGALPADALPAPRSIASPCRNVCRLGRRRGERICIGCGRTPAEIEAWPVAGDALRLAIRRRAAARLAS